jgi:hypothetical protein
MLYICEQPFAVDQREVVSKIIDTVQWQRANGSAEPMSKAAEPSAIRQSTLADD